jgi:transcriptional regulator with XRE-family HTH domain
MRSNDEIMDILDNLKDEKNLSISEIARRVGMAKSAVSRYFNRSRQFPLNRVSEFAKAFGVSPEFILGINRIESGNITDIYNQLDDLRQTKVYKYAKHQLDEQTAINKKDDILIAAHKDENFNKEKELHDYINKLIEEQD